MLNFYWKAQFKDNSIIDQFIDNKEILFKEIIDKVNDLIEFSLINKNNIYKVKIKEGKIFRNNELLYDFSNFYDLKLVYFKRNKFTFSYNLNSKNYEYSYFLGLKYKNNFNKEKEFLLEIDLDGNYKIGER